VDKYTWVDVGSSFLPSDLLAAFLLAQLEEREKIQRCRRRIWETYHSELSAWARDQGARLPIIPNYCEQPYHLFYLLMPSLSARQCLINHLKSHGVLSVFHYLPLHLSPMGRKVGGREGDCPVAESVSDRLVRLPLYNNLSSEDRRAVVDAIYSLRLVR
jgi:dTDP-4-amino-4,6-dideoxygalactose transaminase